jgi:hypothetical protein
MSLTSEPTLRMAMLAFLAVCVIWGVAKGIERIPRGGKQKDRRMDTAPEYCMG